MPVGLFAKKVGMTQVFDESGTIFPVTILKAGTCKISQIKSTTTDGYNAVQVAYEERKIDKLNKSIRGHLKKIGDQGFNSFGEFRVGNPENFKLGQALKVDTFTKGQKIRVTGKSIGKGFAGNQKKTQL
jgi:large subunit ribosomal protein L3